MVREDIRDHHRLERCLAGALFLALFVYLWKGIELHLLYHGFGAFTAYPVFCWEGSFLRATFRTPGAPVRALSALLAQSYSQAWLGALTVTALLGVLWLGIQRLLRSGQAGKFRDLAWVPPLLTLMIYNDYYEDPLPILLAVGLAVWTAVFYGVLPARTAPGRAGLFLALLGPLYYLAGAPALVFAAIACLTEVFLHRKILPVLAQAALAVGGLLVLGGFVFGLERRAIYVVGTPWDPEKPLHFFPAANWLALALHAFIPSLMLVALAGAALLDADARRSMRRRHRPDGRPLVRTRQAGGRTAGSYARVGLRMLGVVVTSVLCLILLQTPAHNERALHFYALQRDWDQVLALAHRMQGHHQFTRAGVFDINRALAHTGRLGSELFAFPQDDFKTLYMRFDDMSGRLTRAKSLELYLDLGCLNAAQENAYELLAHEGPSPPVLDALVRIHLAKGQYESARVFLQALRRYAGCRPYVRRWQPIVADPARAEADPLLQSWRRAKPIRDDTSLGISPAALKRLLEDKPDHRLAFEYLMACMLLRNERGELINHLPLLKPLGYRQLPRHYAEALLVHALMTGTPADAPGWTIDPDVQRQFWEIRSLMTAVAGNDRMLFDTLAPKYGDTYMFYSMFHLCGLK
jgi:hypothetical protein